MELFSGFPSVTYNGQKIKNITVRLNFIKRIVGNASLFQYINIRSGQRPEDIANALYGDPNLYWIILCINNIVDPYYGWLLTDDQVYKFALQKYTNINDVHHYETTSQSSLGPGIVVDENASFSVAVSNITYEQRENEKRRKIKILKKEFINQVIAEYKAELQ